MRRLRITLQVITVAAILLFQISVLFIGLDSSPVPPGSDAITNELLETGSRKASNLTRGWEFLPEDSHEYTYHTLPDSGWIEVDLGTFEAGDWSGNGWFRNHLRIDPTVRDSTISFLYAHYGAIAYYFNGIPIHSSGEIAPDGQTSGESASRFPAPVVLDLRHSGDRELTVHIHSASKRDRMPMYWRSLWKDSYEPGFMIAFVDSQRGRSYHAKELRTNSLLLVTIAALLAISLIHFFIYLSAQYLKETIVYSVYGLILAINAGIWHLLNQHTPHELLELFYFGTYGLFATASFIGLLLIAMLFNIKAKKVVVFGILGSWITLLLQLYVPVFITPIPISIFAIFTFLFVIKGIKGKYEGAEVIAFAYLSLAVLPLFWIFFYGKLNYFAIHLEMLWLMIFIPPFIAFTYIVSGRIGEIWRQREEFHDQVMELLNKSTLLEQQAATSEHVNSEVREFNRRLVNQLEMRTQELIIAERQASFGQFVQGIVHNLKNPLASIIGYTDMGRHMLQELRAKLQSPQPDEAGIDTVMRELEEDVDTVLSGSKQLLEMLNSLMQKSRGDRDSKAVVCDLNECLRAELEFLTVDPRLKKSITVEQQLTDEPLPVKAVRGEITQVISNLVINARDALFEVKNPQIVITSWREGDEVGFDVQDNGSGIRPDNLQRIFDPFFTTKRLVGDENFPATNNTPSGTGLGMWICKQMVSSHGGSIEVDSDVGRGTTISIRLPRYTEHAGETGTRQPHEVSQQAG